MTKGNPLTLPRLSGSQFWTDYAYREGYRVQQKAKSGQWRLLDADSRRIAQGQRESVLETFAQNAPQYRPKKHIVVLLHGLMRTCGSMAPLERRIVKAGFEDTYRFSYASSRQSMSESADALKQVLEAWPECRLSFIGHSMGNIVVRRMLSDLSHDDPTGILNRCESMIMLGPPNQGAAISRMLAPTGLYEFFTGDGGMELGPGWQEFCNHMAVPSFPFAIVAGELKWNWNPLIGRRNDLLVEVDETRLEGCDEFHIVRCVHALLMNHSKVHELIVDFLRSNSTSIAIN